jgi:hypothetical protein
MELSHGTLMGKRGDSLLFLRVWPELTTTIARSAWSMLWKRATGRMR